MLISDMLELAGAGAELGKRRYLFRGQEYSQYECGFECGFEFESEKFQLKKTVVKKNLVLKNIFGSKKSFGKKNLGEIFF